VLVVLAYTCYWWWAQPSTSWAKWQRTTASFVPNPHRSASRPSAKLSVDTAGTKIAMGKYDVTSRRRNGIRAAPAKVLRR